MLKGQEELRLSAHVTLDLGGNMAKKARKAPWKKTNPRKKAGRTSKKLSSSQKAIAKRQATKAGRPYPSLIDNMTAARTKKKPMTLSEFGRGRMHARMFCI